MQHTRSPYITLTVRTQAQGAPAADGDGTSTATLARTIGPTTFPKRLWIQITIAGAGTCNLALWAKDATIATTGVWGLTVDPSGNLSLLANGAAISAGKYFFVFEDVTHCPEIVLVQSGNLGGTPVTTAQVAALIEKQESV